MIVRTKKLHSEIPLKMIIIVAGMSSIPNSRNIFSGGAVAEFTLVI